MYSTKDFVCITLPKCASRSMRYWAIKLHNAKCTFGMHGMSSDPDDYKDKLVILPVRNPYARAISLWKHLRERYNYPHSIEVMLKEFMNIEELTVKPIFKYAQIDYMKSYNFPFNEVSLTFVYMENLETELRALPIPFYKPIHEGRTAGNSLAEIPSLSVKDITLVNEWAKEDFKTLMYSFINQG